MKKWLIMNIILVSLILIVPLNDEGISKEEAEGYIGQNVAIVLNYGITPYLIYGVPIDIVLYDGEWYLLLKTYYNQHSEQFINLKHIHSIRRRYKNE